MELRVLHYFLAVAREQSISAAAESLHLSQPTLSTQLKAMEEELGKQLLIRGTKGSRKVVLTEEGMILRKRAEEILSLVKRTEDEISRSDEVIVGDVYIGAGETDVVRFFAGAAKELQKKYPDIRYHISSGNAEYVLEYLDKGYSRWYAAVYSAKNYFSSILLATLCICVIFFPLLFTMTGQMLDFVTFFPWTLSISLMVSLAVAMVFIPLLERVLIKKGLKSGRIRARRGSICWIPYRPSIRGH